MTAHSFAEYVETAEPETIRASHYNLAPDIYGLADGHAWAFATSGNDGEGNATRHPREHLTEGGEWPYYIAACPVPDPRSADRYTAAMGADALGKARPEDNAGTAGETYADALRAGRILETYCEGDLTAYVFATRDERDGAARAWEETEAEYVARVVVEDCGEIESPDTDKMGAAIVAMIRDYEGAHEPLTRESVETWHERIVHRGSAADYWAEWVEESDATLVSEVRHGYGLDSDKLADQLERRLAEARMAQDWDDYARDRDADTETTERDGFVFDAGR